MIKSIPFTTVSRYIAKLLPQLYDEETLWSHSLDGRKSNSYKEGCTIRPGLPAIQKQEICRKRIRIRFQENLILNQYFCLTGAVREAAKEKTDTISIAEVHLAITNKLSNCSKKRKKNLKSVA
jgi:hypothetical protein